MPMLREGDYSLEMMMKLKRAMRTPSDLRTGIQSISVERPDDGATLSW
jgi:hypothetical protein